MGCKKSFCSVLSGQQQVPIVQTNATGFVKATLKGNTLTVKGCFQNLSSPLFPVGQLGAAHIHGPSLPGSNAPVVFQLTVIPGPGNLSGKFDACQNRFALNEEQLQWLHDGLFYVNIHTEMWQSGEIRGQILPKSGDCCKQYIINLSGLNEIPPVTTNSVGTIVATLNCRTLTLGGTFSGLSSAFQAAHIHLGATGINGAILYNLNVVTLLPNTAGNFLRADNMFTLTKDQLSALKTGGLYVNVHSANFPSGEIRGQILRL